MFQAEYSAKNDGRHLNGSYGRWGWKWRIKSKKVCLQCRRHVVQAGAGTCPRCGSVLAHLSNVPRKGAANWKQYNSYSRHAGADVLYPTAVPRRVPGNGPRKP